MIKRLRRKFIIVNMAIVTVMLAVIFTLVLAFTQRNMEQESIQALRSVSLLPPNDFPDNMPDNPPNNPNDAANNQSDRLSPSTVTIYRTRTGGFIASGSEIIDTTDEELLSELFDTAISAKEQTGVIDEYNLRFCTRRTPMGEAVVLADITGEKQILFQLGRTCAFIALLSFGVFFVISVLLARWMVKPVETAWNRQKQFVADASHELKTPLTVIMTNAEMLLDGNHSPEKRAQFSESILTMSKQMRGLTESLLELAESDNNANTAFFKEVDLSVLVSEAVLPFEPLYYEKELELVCEIQEGVTVIGDAPKLLRLADILLDNAMKYSYPKTQVSVKLKKHRDGCVLSVASHGEGISKSDLKDIFKRFYRVDKARSSRNSYGLGLSIAESIAKQHNGRIWAESEGGVNVFRVKLPLK